MSAQQPALQTKNHRRHTRIKYALDISFAIDWHTYRTELLDLSLGGAFVVIDKIPFIETGTKVLIEIPFMTKPGEVSLQATVKRIDGVGAGVEFF